MPPKSENVELDPLIRITGQHSLFFGSLLYFDETIHLLVLFQTVLPAVELTQNIPLDFVSRVIDEAKCALVKTRRIIISEIHQLI
jgi:hypothetical protein